MVTMSTMIVKLRISRRESQVTFLISATTSPMNFPLVLAGLVAVLSLIIPHLPARWGQPRLSYLPVDLVGAAAGTVLGKFQPLGVILLVLCRGIDTLLAITAGKLDDYPVFAFFRHRILSFSLYLFLVKGGPMSQPPGPPV